MESSGRENLLLLQREKVFDPVQRLLHWAIALSVCILLATAWSHELFEKGLFEKSVWLVHIYSGYFLSLSLALRLLWGLVGPRQARFSSFWHPREWRALLRRPSFRLPQRFGHHPAASLAYLGLYGALLVMIATGLGLAAVEHSTGPLALWLSDSVWYQDALAAVHENLSYLIAAFIALHLGAMVLHERKERVPVGQAMLSGYQYRHIHKESSHEKK